MQKVERSSPIKGEIDEKTILVVEDDTSIGALLVEALAQETPYSAMLVTDGIQALNVARSIKPCLFITDYWLPNINGLELYDLLQATKELVDTPTIIMSAYLPEQEINKRNLVGLNKPFDLDEFLEAVEKLLA
ncbi:MAG TPA: response regulator [Ktedonobacteraceae bacterium]|nr:response regulator [Ktedonobacteraceae bacterium]